MLLQPIKKRLLFVFPVRDSTLLLSEIVLSWLEEGQLSSSDSDYLMRLILYIIFISLNYSMIQKCKMLYFPHWATFTGDGKSWKQITNFNTDYVL